MSGIDTPEIRSGTVRAFGKHVRDVLKSLILKKIVKVVAGKFDKYGRLLVEVSAMTADGVEIDVGAELVACKMAREYHGGRKKKWTRADEN